MTDSADNEDDERLTYADSGVDIEASEDATAALLEAFGSDLRTEYAGLIDIGDRYLALATDGVARNYSSRKHSRTSRRLGSTASR